jgi:hypothetical protein
METDILLLLFGQIPDVPLVTSLVLGGHGTSSQFSERAVKEPDVRPGDWVTKILRTSPRTTLGSVSLSTVDTKE